MDCYAITIHLKTSGYYFQTDFRCIGILGIPVSFSTLVIAQKVYTHWLIRILNFESRISDIESRISNDPSGLSHLSVVTTCSWNGVYSVMGSNHVIRSTFSL